MTRGDRGIYLGGQHRCSGQGFISPWGSGKQPTNCPIHTRNEYGFARFFFSSRFFLISNWVILFNSHCSIS